jgi:hypothetical protein
MPRAKKEAYQWKGKGFRQDIRTITNDIVAIEIIRNQNKGPDPLFATKMGGYKAILRTDYDQFIVYPKQVVNYKGTDVVIEDLIVGWITETLHSKEVAPSSPKTKESPLCGDEDE